MAYVLNGKKLRVGKAFVDPATSIQYPANWLRLASEDDKAAIGVVWEVDPAPVDGRFYWSEGNPKRLEDENATDENGDPRGVSGICAACDACNTPSRTAVNLSGDVFIANRALETLQAVVTKVANDIGYGWTGQSCPAAGEIAVHCVQDPQ